ncbi:MAG TPA: ATP-binding protein, partial [Thermodesulfobacteriota bacterium]|nr:ATP-binding protein [Thermodesulfobacteriota bacterium]
MDTLLRERLKWSLALRVAVVTLMLGAAAAIQAALGEPVIPRPLTLLYTLIGLTYALTVPYALALSRLAGGVRLFAYGQIVHDLLFATATVALTGGIESPFVVLYTVAVVNASLLLYRRGVALAVAASGAALALVAYLQTIGVVDSGAGGLLGPQPVAPRLPDRRQAALAVGLNVPALAALGLLASYLADQLRRTGERLAAKSVDLAQLEAMNRLIVRSIQSGLLTVSSDGRITSFNRAAEEITGRAASEVLGRPVSEIFPGIELDVPSRWGERWEVEYTRPSGQTLTLGFSVSALRDDEGTARADGEAARMLGRIVLFQDLTPYKALEEQVRQADRLAAVGRLAAGMAHEIRNPLASMSGSVQLLRQELVTASEEHRRLMDIIVRETDRLNALITDFLLFARPGEARRELVDLAALADETLLLFRNQGHGEVRVEADLERPLAVLGSPRELRQVIWNLLVNAAQAMPGGGDIVLRGRAGAGWVELTVRDSGEGIRAEHLPRIFDPFFTTKPDGTGLGLAIVYRVVESHGGSIAVASRPGAGATFTVRLPTAGTASVLGETGTGQARAAAGRPG